MIGWTHVICSTVLLLGLQSCAGVTPAPQDRGDAQDETSDERSATGEEAREEGAAGVASVKAQPKKPSRPRWVDNPYSFYDEPRPDLVLVVGTSTQSGMMGEMMAAREAREMFSKAIGRQQVTLAVEKKDEARKEAFRSEHSGKIDAGRSLKTWKSPAGEIFILMATAGRSVMKGESPSPRLDEREPVWVEKPESFFKSARPDLLLAVGTFSASKGQRYPGGEGGMRRRAVSEATKKALLTFAREKGEAGEGGEGYFEKDLGPLHELAYWMSPERDIHVLVAIERELTAERQDWLAHDHSLSSKNC